MAERTEVLDIDLTSLIDQTEEAGKTLGDLKDEIKELKKSLDGAAIGSEDFENKLNLLTKAQNELKTVTKTVSKDVKGSYNALSKEMSDLKKEWKATGDEAKRAKLGERIDEINNQLKELDSTVGVSTRNVGNYQSALEGLNDVSFEDKIESSEKLAENFGHVARIGAGISGIFEIVQGGLNLMGVESEKIEEAMIKIQSLMAITQGLSAVGDSVESFTKLAKAIKDSEVWTRLFTRAKKQESSTIVANTAVQNANTVATKAGTVAIQGFKAALISTGIGALIVALGVGIEKLITNWDKLTGKLSKKVTAEVEIKYDMGNISSDTLNIYKEEKEKRKNQKRNEFGLASVIAEDIFDQNDQIIKEAQRLNNILSKTTDVTETILQRNLVDAYKSVVRNIIDGINQTKTDDELIIAELREKIKNEKDKEEKNKLQNTLDAFVETAKAKRQDMEKVFAKADTVFDQDYNIKDDIIRFVDKYFPDQSSYLIAYSDAYKKLVDTIIIENDKSIKEAEKIATDKANETKSMLQTIVNDTSAIIDKDIEDTISKWNSLETEFEKIKSGLDVGKDKELKDLETKKNNELKIIESSYNEGLILEEVYLSTKNELIKKYEEDKVKIVQKYNDEIIAVETSRYRTADNKLYAGYSGKITESEEKGYGYESGTLKLDYYKKQLSLLDQHKQKLIELQATEEQLSEVEAMIADNRTNQHLAEIEQLQGKLDGMNLVFETTMGYADSIISMSDGLSSAWSNVYASLQNGINMLGESLQKGEKDWRAYANTIGSVMGVTSSVMAALADQQSKTNYENEEDRKKGFEKQKDFQVAAVTMNTLAGVLNATTSAFSPNNAWMTPAGQAAVAAAMSASIIALGAVQISKIKATPYEGGGGDVSSNAPSLSALTQMGGNVQNTHNIEGASQEGKVKDTKIYVTETDISSTQDNVKATVDEASF